MAVANPNVVSRSRLPPSSPCPDPAGNRTPAAPNTQPPSTTSLTLALPSSRWRPCRQRQRRRAPASWLRRPPRMCSDSGCVALPAHRAQQLRSNCAAMGRKNYAQPTWIALTCVSIPMCAQVTRNGVLVSPPPSPLPPLSFHLPSFPPCPAPFRPALQHELYQLQGAMVNSGRLTMAGGAPGGSSSSDPLNGQLNKSLARAVIKLGARVSVLESKVGA